MSIINDGQLMHFKQGTEGHAGRVQSGRQCLQLNSSLYSASEGSDIHLFAVSYSSVIHSTTAGGLNTFMTVQSDVMLDVVPQT